MIKWYNTCSLIDGKDASVYLIDWIPRLRTAGMKLRFFFLLFSAVSPSQLLLLVCILVVQLYSYVQQLAVQLAAYS